MFDVKMFTLVFTGIWCLVGVIFLCVGLAMRKSALNREERLRARTSGTVIEVVRHGGANGAGWFPIVEFEADGRRISLESRDGSGARRFYEGQAVEVLYDPDDPACFQLEGMNTVRLVGTIFTWVGLGSIAVGLIAALIVNGVKMK